MKTCLALLSGSLDSMLAIRLMQEQGFAVTAVYFASPFGCGAVQPELAARRLDVPLLTATCDDEREFFNLLREPRFGFSGGVNPCIDCRIAMLTAARRWLEAAGADFVISGEVLGQRPFGQKRQDLETIAYHAGLEDRVLRPLSAKVLPPTEPELDGRVDRERLFAFQGRARSGLFQLARELGLHDHPPPTRGCPLTEPCRVAKVRDLLATADGVTRWDLDLFSIGRHFRFDRQTRVVLGRREAENQQIAALHARADAPPATLLQPQNFPGATALLIGPPTAEPLAFTAGLIWRFSQPAVDNPRVSATTANELCQILLQPHTAADSAVPIA